MSRTGFGMEVEPGRPIPVSRWLNRMWLDPVRKTKADKRKTKPRRALTVVQKKQGVPVLIVNEEDQWDACTKIAEDKDTNEAVMAFYREIKDLSLEVTPGKDRVLVVPLDTWRKMVGSNLFIGQFKKKKEEANELVDGLPEGTQESS